ncbi:hypothetical protein N7E81_10730 [Reichenbachiella carrageenanivorans]|uniref:Uncharacterized protein n=1 Tax=Reichenbachiella carrageenanivorans TaxID=2979869 RepID=A0ABY6CVB0_9BACT|nr:hypothetical protein [Reichenbachiella carrageenanivorans]UXX77842.1 hypothetical protein N7E81_10730 [Reichenbachiella carrageenanivorans]
MTTSDYISIIALLISCIALGLAFFQHLSNRKNTLRLLVFECTEKLRDLESRVYNMKIDTKTLLEETEDSKIPVDRKKILSMIETLEELNESFEKRFNKLQSNHSLSISKAQELRSSFNQHSSMIDGLFDAFKEIKLQHKELIDFNNETD